MELTEEEVNYLGMYPHVLATKGLIAVDIPYNQLYKMINQAYGTAHTKETRWLSDHILSCTTVDIEFINGYSRSVSPSCKSKIRMHQNIVVRLDSDGNGFHPSCASHEMHLNFISDSCPNEMKFIEAVASFHGFEIQKREYGHGRFIIKNKFPETQMIYADIHPHNNGVTLMALRRAGSSPPMPDTSVTK